MKKRLHILIALLLVAVALVTLSACDEKEDKAAVTPAYLQFENPYDTSTLLNPVLAEDFDITKVTINVVMSDGSVIKTGLPVSTSLFSPDNTGTTDIAPGTTSRQTFLIDYVYQGTKIHGSFFVYLRSPNVAAEYVTFYFFTNGGNPGDFAVDFVKGTKFETWADFV
ncbi:MAG: hypothetical protein GX891_01195, partial [Clostridiales bacterium]|nr:hypothetical protein [Clostridiales bacterium]